MSEHPSPQHEHSAPGRLPAELSENLRRVNPWWRGEPGLPAPPFRRWPFEKIRHLLDKGIAPSTVLRGPRRVGKTILLRQIIDSLLAEGVTATRILYVAFDELPTLRKISEPVLAIARWFEDEILRTSFNATARDDRPAYIFLDEVQNLDAWAPQIKNLDRGDPQPVTLSSAPARG